MLNRFDLSETLKTTKIYKSKQDPTAVKVIKINNNTNLNQKRQKRVKNVPAYCT
jgi:hypothetical protein